MGVGPEKNQHCLPRQLPQESPLPCPWEMQVFSTQIQVERRLLPGWRRHFFGCGEANSTEGGETPSAGKEDSSQFREFNVSASSGSSRTSPSQLTGSHSFPINALILTVDTLSIQLVL